VFCTIHFSSIRLGVT